MNERIKELMLKAGYAAPEIAKRAHLLSELIIQDIIQNIKVWEKDSRNHISYMVRTNYERERDDSN